MRLICEYCTSILLKKQNDIFYCCRCAVFLLTSHLMFKHVSKIMDEQQLAEKCRQGDNRARKELYEQYAGRMLTICTRYVSDKDLAQDLLHDGFLKIFHSFDKFTYRGEGSLRAWIERIFVNESLQCLRKNDILSKSATIEDTLEIYNQPEEESIEMIPHSVLLQFIEELPAGYRTIFNLYTFEDKSHKEIAELLGINEKSSSSQLFRAKNTLAKKINEWLKTND